MQRKAKGILGISWLRMGGRKMGSMEEGRCWRLDIKAEVGLKMEDDGENGV
ncbi:uncharacterized protein G2W53_044439 [Senna tora]|uniref:Uncharacterized protein n=1 Tax=Senna tora TaxID=362788 RepID=A0A834SEW3_9FABA|nr:uncharacterized protein G2W53_044439 [Senna tora]